MKAMFLAKTFPHYHRSKGQPTNFHTKYLKGEKVTTIRAGKGYKVGELRSLKEWSGRPYHTSPRILDVVLITKIEDIEISENGIIWIADEDGKEMTGIGCVVAPFNALSPDVHRIAEQDGLRDADFTSWFDPFWGDGKKFVGQRIFFEKAHVEDKTNVG